MLVQKLAQGTGEEILGVEGLGAGRARGQGSVALVRGGGGGGGRRSGGGGHRRRGLILARLLLLRQAQLVRRPRPLQLLVLLLQALPPLPLLLRRVSLPVVLGDVVEVRVVARGDVARAAGVDESGSG